MSINLNKIGYAIPNKHQVPDVSGECGFVILLELAQSVTPEDNSWTCFVELQWGIFVYENIYTLTCVYTYTYKYVYVIMYM